MNLSGVLRDVGDSRSAKERYEKALEIEKKHFGEDHLEYATTLGRFMGYGRLQPQPTMVMRRH